MGQRLTSRFLMIFIFVLSLSLPGVVQAFPLGDLDLSDEQKEALKSIRVATKSEIEPLIEDLQDLHVHMEELILAEEDIAGEAAMVLIDQIVGKRSEIMKIVASSRLEAAQILTLEQREIIHQKREGQREKRQERREQRKERLGDLKEWLDFML